MACQLDLQKARAPLTKLASEEYFRALEGHKSVKQFPKQKLPNEIVYLIDKEIRLKFRRDKEINKRQLSNYASSQLESVAKAEKSAFAAWLQKKNTEDRIKKNLMLRALKKQYENDLLNEQNREEKLTQNIEQMKKWEINKIYEKVQKSKSNKHIKIEIENEKILKRQRADDHYKEWLRNNMMKLKKQKQLKRLEKNKEAEIKKKNEEEKEKLRQKNELNFRRWLKQKRRKTKRPMSTIEQKIKIKKPVMLAYSPNKKFRKEGENIQGSVSSINDTPVSLVSERKFTKKFESKPPVYNNYNELSSIVKSKGKKVEVDDSGNDSQGSSFDENDYNHDKHSEKYQESGYNEDSSIESSAYEEGESEEIESSYGPGNLSF